MHRISPFFTVKDTYQNLDVDQLEAIDNIDLEIWSMFDDRVIDAVLSGNLTPIQIANLAKETYERHRKALPSWTNPPPT